MNNYRPSTPRAALGIVAVAMSAATCFLFVVAPTMMESGGERPDMQMATAASPPVKDAAIVPMRIEVWGRRQTSEVSAAATAVDVKGGVQRVDGDLQAAYRVVATRSEPLMSADGRISQ